MRNHKPNLEKISQYLFYIHGVKSFYTWPQVMDKLRWVSQHNACMLGENMCAVRISL